MRSKIFVVLILFIVNVQTFITDEFRSAMHHIENGFEKLFSDVVNDIEGTLDCTISAIEHVLIVNSILDKTSDFNKKCLDGSSSSFLNVKDAEHRRQIESGVLNKLPDTAHTAGDDNSKNIFSKDLHSSIASVNKTLHNIKLLKSRNDTRDDLLEPLQDDNNRLSEVSILLRRELGKISYNVKSELEKINFDGETPETLIWDEIQILRKVENGSDASDVNELHHIVGSALDILKPNNNSNFERSNNRMEKIIQELEDTDSIVRSEGVQSNVHDENIIHNDFLQISQEEHNKHVLEDKILNSNNLESRSTDHISSIFDTFDSANDEKHAEEEVLNIINDSKFTDLLFNNENTGIDIFENVHLFNF